MSDYLMHKGTPHEGNTPHSGRYPWGSGEHAFQRLDDGFTRMVRNLRKQGLSDEEIVKGLGLTSLKHLHEREATAKVVAMREAGKSVKEISEETGLKMEVIRNKITMAREYNRNIIRKKCQELAEKGIGATEGGKILGIPESSFRTYLNEAIAERSNKTTEIAGLLKDEFKTKDYIDIGGGSEHTFNCSETKLKAAVQMLEEEGYEKYNVYVEQMGIVGQKTTVKVLAPPGTKIQDIYDNIEGIKPIGKNKVVNDDGQITKLGLEPFTCIKDKRIMVRYGDEGGKLKDGVIELRRGVDDISLGRANYAQVRIGVNDKYYMKGMAIYGQDKDFPPGIDIIYNSNRVKGTPLFENPTGGETVFKKMKTDEANPFGTSIKSSSELVYTQKKGSAINIVNEEGDWDHWSRTLASQFLSKQPLELAKKQLKISYADKLGELDDIRKINNPTLKKQMLLDFAEDCDASAVHLKAAALPGQAAKVILPSPSLPDGQIYAPHLKNGERVVLVRYPHGGQFEIPELVVNNNHVASKRTFGNLRDAVAINLKAAQQLSGADFDGDTAVVIPVTRNGRRIVNVQTQKPLEGLKDFDTGIYAFENPNESQILKGSTKQRKMGETTNLITDMTIKGAPPDEIARAVKHSMVIIDAEKHKLDYKKSYKDQNIKELRERYQVERDENGKKVAGGAGTIISRAKSEYRVPKRYSTRHIDPKTGKWIYKENEKTYTNKKGEEVKYTMKSTKMAEADDAFELVSAMRKPMEIAYAQYANSLKSLANETRKEAFKVKETEVNKTMAKKYEKEVKSLKSKLRIAEENRPRERQAQIIANETYLERTRDADRDLDNEDKKKIRGQALARARVLAGAKKEPVVFTDKEWEAIQSGAVPKTTQTKLFKNADPDRLRKLATPKESVSKVTPGMIARIKAMAGNSAYTISDIAQALGVSTSTVSKYMK